MEIEFKSKFNELLLFRELNNADAVKLGSFFELLSEETKSKFGPHPLTKENADLLCHHIGSDNISRFIISNALEIIGYFILDFNPFKNEASRYQKFGIELDSNFDPVFAPCIADRYQNQGVGSQAMIFILNYARSRKLRSIVLMGGTQESNMVARSFYKKFGFKEYSKFFTEHNGLENIDMMLNLDSI